MVISYQKAAGRNQISLIAIDVVSHPRWIAVLIILSSIPFFRLDDMERHWDRAIKITTFTNMCRFSTREKSYKGLARTKSVTEKIASTELSCGKGGQSNSVRVYSGVLSLNDSCTTKGEKKQSRWMFISNVWLWRWKEKSQKWSMLG